MGIRTKLLLPLLTLLIVIIGSVEFYWLPTLTELEEIKQVQNQSDQLRILEIALVDTMVTGNLANMHQILNDVLDKHHEWKRLYVRKQDGRRLYPISEIPDIEDGDHVFRLTHPITYLNNTLGIIYLSADLSEYVDDLEYQLRVLDWLLLFILPLVAVASALLQDRFVLRPLHKLASAVSGIAHGDFNVQLPKHSNDEVGQLIKAFDGMRVMRNSAENALEKLAYFDMLTRLPNRMMFKNHLTSALTNVKQSNHNLSLMFIDLDRFKVINDTLGHEVGDLLLVEAAERLEKCIRPGDLVARLGGDEFTIVVDENSKHSGSRIISERIIEAFKKPFVFGGQKTVISPSIGISMYPEHAADYGTMMQYADTAMYQAKAKGGNCYLYYSPEMGDKLTHHMNIEAGLRRALEEEEFVLHYQPKVEISTGKIVGMEALIRWMDPEKGMVSPNDFIPLAEETGLIIPIGEWVLRKACEQCLEWGKADIEIAINLSANHLYDPSLLIMLQTALQETGFPPGRLEIEITENSIMRNVQQTITILEQIKSLGVKVAIDDFGTGYSSLSYLKRFAIDTIKIDRSFVSGIPHNADEVAITSATVVMAQNLKRRVIAEGIETEEQAAFLNQLGCEMGQGYYYSRPLPSAEIAAMLSNSHYLSWPKPKLVNKKQ